jgi:hypothetical protein
VLEDKGTCGFVQRVPVGARRAISAQKKNDPETGRSVDPAEVGGPVDSFKGFQQEPKEPFRLRRERSRDWEVSGTLLR